MKFRSAQTTDLDLLATWNHQLIADEGHRNPMTPPELRQRMADWLERGEYECLIFTAGGEDVGYALFKEAVDEIHLRHFFVRRDRRRLGHGRAAMEALIFQVWPRTKRLRVDVLIDNANAIAFWRQVGYRDYSLTLELPPKQTSREPLHSILESLPPKS